MISYLKNLKEPSEYCSVACTILDTTWLGFFLLSRVLSETGPFFKCHFLQANHSASVGGFSGPFQECLTWMSQSIYSESAKR